jgi:hypothetical protein
MASAMASNVSSRTADFNLTCCRITMSLASLEAAKTNYFVGGNTYKLSALLLPIDFVQRAILKIEET